MLPLSTVRRLICWQSVKRLSSSSEITWLTAADVRSYHEFILEPQQLQGEYSERPIEAALNRVEQQVYYEQIEADALQVAATYAVAISRAHSFADGNKRTALVSMLMFLDAHGYSLDTLDVDGTQLVLWMEECASGEFDDDELYSLILEYLTELPEEGIQLCEICCSEPVEHPDTTLCVGCETVTRQMDRDSE